MGELCGLRVGDLDFNWEVAQVDGKTCQRPLPFGRRTKLALDRHLRAAVFTAWLIWMPSG